MSDIGKPRGPSASDDLLRPDAGFHDDKVGGQLKSEEAARRRAAQARLAARPKHIDQEPQKVSAAASFKRSAREEDPVSAEAKRHQRALVAGQPAPRREAKGRAGGQRLSGEAERLTARVHTLFGAMVTLEHGLGEPPAKGEHAKAATGGQKVQAVGEDDAQGQKRQAPPREQAPAAPSHKEDDDKPKPPDGITDAAARLARAQQQARFGVQHLLAGGTGFVLDEDPSVSFGALFARLPTWPTQVPPGRTPQSREDFDAFFAWVFTPDVLPHGLEPQA